MCGGWIAQSKPADEMIKVGRLGEEGMHSSYVVLLPDATWGAGGRRQAEV